MARNVEIKARVPNLSVVRAKALSLEPASVELIGQIDTFFSVPRGRLKIREFGDGSGELISYERPDRVGPKESVYVRVSVDDPRSLVEALSCVLSVRGQVRKRREVFVVGRTRIHLDEVEGLGSFVELEVVLRDDDRLQSGEQEAERLMEALGISPSDLVVEAYIDMLERTAV